METKKWTLLCVGMVALLVLGLVESGVAISQQAHKGDNSGLNGQALGNGQQEQVEQQKEEVKALNNGSKGVASGQVKKEIPQLAAIKAPITVVHKAQGFALNESGDGFHVLRVNILKVGQIHPSEIRGLMGENKNISEIRARIENMTGGAPFYRGDMRLGENYYRLVNISVSETEDGGNRTFDADVVGPLGNMSIVGNISVTVMPYEGVWIGDGTLNMYDGEEYSGEYRVLLDVLPPHPRSILRGR